MCLIGCPVAHHAVEAGLFQVSQNLKNIEKFTEDLINGLKIDGLASPTVLAFRLNFGGEAEISDERLTVKLTNYSAVVIQDCYMLTGKILAAIGSLAIIIIIFAYNHGSWINKSAEYTPRLQAQASEAEISFFTVFTDFPYLYLAVAALLFAFKEQRPRCCYYILAFAGSSLLSDVLKLAFHDPRPYWLTSEIETDDSCKTQFGNPSGHSNSAVSYMMVLYFDYLFDVCKYNPDRWFSSPITKLILFVAVNFIWVVIGYSRVLIGMHGWDQVVFGWTIGWWNVFVYHFIAQKPFRAHIYELVLNPKAQNHHSKYLRIAIALHFVVLTFCYVLYAILD